MLSFFFNMQDAGHLQRSKMQAMYREDVEMCVFLGTRCIVLCSEKLQMQNVFFSKMCSFSKYIALFFERIHAVHKSMSRPDLPFSHKPWSVFASGPHKPQVVLVTYGTAGIFFFHPRTYKPA